MNNCNLTPVGLHPHRVHFLLVVLYMDPLSNQAIPTLISQFLAADRNRTHLGREILQYGREEQSLFNHQWIRNSDQWLPFVYFFFLSYQALH